MAPAIRIRSLASFLLICCCLCRSAFAAIEAFPPEIRLDGARSRQQVIVTIRAGEGEASDATTRPETSYRIEPGGIAVVTKAGVVLPRADGEGRLIIAASGETITLPLTVRDVSKDRPASYRNDVAAVLSKAGCNMGACHGNLNGKGGLKLSLRGEDADADYLTLTREVFGRRIDPNDADNSLMLLKPTGRVGHEGGLRFASDSPEAETLKRWIVAGAADDRASAPKLRGLRIFPESRLNAAPWLSQQLAVTAEFEDGTTRDVTREASYDLNDPTKAEISADGCVTAERPVEIAVAVRYLEGRAVARVGFVADRPGYRWTGPEAATVFDEKVFAKLRALKINPAPAADDATLVRRAYLDVLGVLPTAEEVRAFLQDDSPEKVRRLAEALVERPEFADYWALKWSDLLRNEERTMGAKGNWALQRWLRDAIAADMPLDQLARSLVGTVGSTWTNPETAFHRTNRDPDSAAEAFAQVFLGYRMQCAKCHSHPFDIWTQDDYYGLAACFANLKHKQLNNKRRDNNDQHEINGDEIIYAQGRPRIAHPRTGKRLAPRPPGGEPLPIGRDDPLAVDDLAAWLITDNRQFARNMANRAWFHLLGRGVVEPVDDFRESNPPSDPELLDALADSLVESGYRLKPLVVRILSSETYRRAASADETNADDESNFARAQIKPLPAEVIHDAIGRALGTPVELPGLPEGIDSVQSPQVNTASSFLKAFGKPPRQLTCECERSEASTLAQAFQMINGDWVRKAISSTSNRIGKLLDQGRSETDILGELYLSTLSRPPTPEEQAGALAYIRRGKDSRSAWEDLAWALINSKEFILRH